MADNLSVLDGAGATRTLAADEVAGVHHPRHKVSVGADGSAADLAFGQAAAAASLPVVLASDQSAVPVSPAAVAGSTADVHAPNSNTAAVVTYAASPGVRHAIHGVAWSYTADPTGGNLKVEDGGNTVFTVDVTKGGPGAVQFPRPLKAANTNTALVVTLAAGGANCTGKVSVLNHWTE